MNNFADSGKMNLWENLSSLQKSVEKARKSALLKRFSTKPRVSDLEYLLGAFIEMYEPHLENIIYKLAEKGYTIDPSSGFGGKNAEFQVISGNFTIDYITRNKLEKLGVKFREYNGSNSLIFWPEKATLEEIIARWNDIIKILPDHGVLNKPSTNYQAIRFRRKYIPEHTHLQKQRLFEKLRYNIQRRNESDIKKRIHKNPHPDRIELTLGLFVEELEPQVRQAILTLYKKGYSTDASGFMDNPCSQMIEGDFQLEEKTVIRLKTLGAEVETNPSKYTRLQFTPQEADILRIKRKWNKIATLFPDRQTTANPSMTRKARDFRMIYQ